MKIFLKITETLENKLPFVVYRKPNNNYLQGWFQKDDNLFFTTDFTDSGFVFAPFDSDKKAILIPENQANYLEEKINLNNINFIENNITSNNSSKEKHINLVEKGIDAIKKGCFKKVVLSRKETISLSDFNAANSLQKLLVNYTNAFTYIWYHPKIGLWMGATPETLIKIKNNEFTTMSLAGTQPYKNTINVNWQPKEIEEQQLVTEYISNKLSLVCKQLNISNTETVRAGNLLHLQTLISGKTTDNTTNLLIKKLHPTPAVCGLPLENSKKFILDNENYSREYYTGFLGELNLITKKINSSELFVNLRCVNINNNLANIFVGGGITADSIADKEWLETVAKTKTIKKVL